MKQTKHKKNFRRIYFLEIFLFIPILILGIISWFFGKVIGLEGQILLYIAFFYLASWWITIIIIEFILIIIKNRKTNIHQKKFKKKPKIFEYVFFLGLFWATALITDAYSQEITSGLSLFKFLNTFGAAVFCFGIASACGWYHYIERLDDD